MDIRTQQAVATQAAQADTAVPADTVATVATQAVIATQPPVANHDVVAAQAPVVAQVTPYSDSVIMNAELEALGETIGQFKPYDSQLPIADIKQTRIVKCLYQAGKVNGVLQPKKHQNSYVRVGCKHLTEEGIVARISELAPFMLSYLQDVENKMVKDLHMKGLLRITEGNLTLDKIIDKLEETGESARLNKEMITAWFDKEIAGNLAIVFAEKMDLDIDSNEVSDADLEKLELILNAYKTKFSSLASPKVFINESDCKAMILVIKECVAESTLLGNRFIAKLDKMSEKQEDLLMSL